MFTGSRAREGGRDGGWFYERHRLRIRPTVALRAAQLAVFWGRMTESRPRGTSSVGYTRSGVMYVCMYVRGGGVIFDLVRSRQRYLFAVVSPWKDSIGFMKVVVYGIIRDI